MIWADLNIHSLELSGHHHKLCLLVDNVLLFMSSPLISSPKLLHLLDQFGWISGLLVNSQKSSVLNVSLPSTLFGQLKTVLTFSLITLPTLELNGWQILIIYSPQTILLC